MTRIVDQTSPFETMVEQVQELPDKEREAVLRTLCNDGELQGRVLRFVRAMDRRTNEMLDRGRQPGMILGPYRLVRLIGSGATAEVWHAENKLGRNIALKLFDDALPDKKNAADASVQEAKLVAQIHSDHVIHVNDAGTLPDGTHYVEMELCHEVNFPTEARSELVIGHSLNSYARERHIRTERAVEIAIGICKGIEAVARHKIAHGDLKPANVLISPSGRPQVTDFGAATSTDEQGNPITPLTVGTPAYMSPERIAGGGPSAQGDIYAIGAILYFLLAGRDPDVQRSGSSSDIPGVNGKDQSCEWYDPLPLPMRVPARLGRICRKAMSRRPEDRYRSPAIMAHDLSSWLSASSTSLDSRAMGLWLGMWRSRKVVLVIMVLVGLAAWLYGMYRIELAEFSTADQAMKREAREKEKARQAADDAKIRGSEASMQSARSAQTPSDAAILAACAIEIDDNSRSRGALLQHTQGLPHEAWSRGFWGTSATTPLFDRSGDHVALAFQGANDNDRNWGGMCALQVNTGQVAPGLVSSPAQQVVGMSLDALSGRFVLICGQGSTGFTAIDAGTHEPVKTLENRLISFRMPAAIIDNGARLVLPYGRSLDIFDLATSHLVLTRTYPSLQGEINRVSGSPTGDALAASTDKGELVLLDLNRNDGFVRLASARVHSRIRTFRSVNPGGKEILGGYAEPGAWHICWSPDGREVVATPGTTRVYVYDAASGKRLDRLAELGGGDTLTDLAIAPDGRRLATAQWDRTIRIWDFLTGALLTRVGTTAPPVALEFSPDAKRLIAVAADGTVYCWDELGSCGSYAAPSSGVRQQALSRDGGLIACAGQDANEGIYIYDSTTGCRLTVLPSDRWEVKSLVFGTGSMLAVCESGGVIRVFDAREGRLIRRYATSAEIERVAFSPSGRLMACLGEDEHLRLWRINNAEIEKDWKLGERINNDAHHPICDLRFFGEDRLYAWYQGTPPHVWDLHHNTALSIGSGSDAISVVDSPDGSLVAILRANDTIIYDSEAGRTVGTLPVRQRLRWLTFSRDNQRICTVDMEGSLAQWTVNGKEVNRLSRKIVELRGIWYSDDGDRLIVVDRSSCVFFDTQNGAELALMPWPEAATELFSSASTHSVSPLLTSTLGSDHLNLWHWNAMDWKMGECVKNVEMLTGIRLLILSTARDVKEEKRLIDPHIPRFSHATR